MSEDWDGIVFTSFIFLNMLPYLIYKRYKAQRRRGREERASILSNSLLPNGDDLSREEPSAPENTSNIEYIEHVLHSHRLGLSIEVNEGVSFVRNVHYCSEAHRCGVMVGDIIVSVNGSHASHQRLLESSTRPIRIRFCRNPHLKASIKQPVRGSNRQQIQALEAQVLSLEQENALLLQRVKILEGDAQEISRGLFEVEDCNFLKSTLEKALQVLDVHKMKIYRKKIEMESSKDFMLCVICQDRDRGSRLDPCGHVILCTTCATSPLLRACPMCRARISGYQPIFLA